MIRAVILTPWTQDAEGLRYPLVMDLWQGHGIPWQNLHDITAQEAARIPPDPNLAAWQVDAISAEGLALVEADETYLVLWSEEV